jgi:hypothetical protein
MEPLEKIVHWHYLQLEVEDHAQFASIRGDGTDQLLLAVDTWHLAHTECIVLLKDGA